MTFKILPAYNWYYGLWLLCIPTFFSFSRTPCTKEKQSIEIPETDSLSLSLDNHRGAEGIVRIIASLRYSDSFLKNEASKVAILFLGHCVAKEFNPVKLLYLSIFTLLEGSMTMSNSTASLSQCKWLLSIQSNHFFSWTPCRKGR